jgi:hypothetical protein
VRSEESPRGGIPALCALDARESATSAVPPCCTALGGLAWGADTSLVADVDVEAGSGLHQSTSQRPVARLRSPRYKGVVSGLDTTSALASRCASHPASQSCPRDISDVWDRS